MKRVDFVKLLNCLQDLKTSKMELISSYQEGYIGKKTYKVTYSDGKERYVDQIIKNKGDGDAVVIIPITPENNFIMIIESRPLIDGGVAMSFPAGMVDDGEDKLVAAKRELLEETGYESKEIYELEWHYQDQGCSKAKITTYVALGCMKVSNQMLDENERLVTQEVTYDEVLKLVKENKNEISDANTKIAFMNYTLKEKGLL